MNVREEYLEGQPVAVVKRFFDIDPLTDEATPEDPDIVTFTTLDPNGVQAVYVFGAAAEVTNPDVGVYLLSLPPQDPVGSWKWRCASSGSGLIDAEEGAFDIVASGVIEPEEPEVAVWGPCSPWINGDDIAACGADLGLGSDTWLLDDVAFASAALLYELTARLFAGVCEQTARPCADACTCFGFSPSLGLGQWAWGWLPGQGGVGGWWWTDDCGNQCGCGVLSRVLLSGYPVRKIEEVKIGGVPLLEFDADSGLRNWRLDYRRYLTRMSTPEETVMWPACQNLGLDDDQPGTFSIRYKWGQDVPALGRAAAAQLGRELWLACNGKDCKLPNKVTKIVRAGITMDRLLTVADSFRAGSTGIQLVDAWIANVNPNKAMRRPMVWSPDRPRYAKRLGQ